MRKLFVYAFMALSVLAGCTTDSTESAFVEPGNSPLDGIAGRVKDFILDDATRTTLTIGDAGVSFAWAETDEVGIVPEDVSSSQMLWTVKDISEDLHDATFQNSSYALSPDCRFVAYYPYKSGAEYRYNQKLAVDYTGQTQPENATTAHLGAYDYMYAPIATATAEGKASFDFSHIGAMLYINVKLPGVGATLSKVSVKAEDAEFNVKGEVSFTDGTFTATETASCVDLALNNISLMPGDELTACMMIAPVNLAGRNLTVEVTTSNGVVLATQQLTGKTYRAGRAYRLAVGEMLSGDAVVIENGHAAVDLGLTSGTKWATMNVGATAPLGGAEAIGDFFAWGETEPYYSKITWNSDLNTPSITWRADKDASVGYYYPNYFDYKGGTTTSDAAWYTFGKGADKLHSLRGSEHNAVNQLWGGEWQLPTPTQFTELINEGTWDLYYNNGKFIDGVGISGYKITGKNGLSIYLPLPGTLYKINPFLIVDGTTYTTGKRGCYWTSEIGYEPQHATVFYTQYNLSKTVSDNPGFGRASGCAYRPVLDK